MNLLTNLCIILAIIYWIYRFSRSALDLISYFNIRAFYAQALDIKPVGFTYSNRFFSLNFRFRMIC